MSTTKIRARVWEDQIILPCWPIYWWILMVLMTVIACMAILPLMLSVPLFIALLNKGEHGLVSLFLLGPIVALSLCLVYDLCKGKCVLMDWHGGTFLYGMAEFLTPNHILNVLVLGRAKDVLRRVKADGHWILEFKRRWPFGWTQLKFTIPLDRIGPVGLHVPLDHDTNEPEALPTSCVYFGERIPHVLELFPADATAVAERLRQWEQEALS
jgi:hypothetical protein